MLIKEMFRKEIDREIQGVIIAGQGESRSVAQELDEYVVTRELRRHFRDFFTAYKKGIVGTTPKMGVWISGFFGSGKSHFLKTISYLLKNEVVGNRRAIEYFTADQKIDDPAVLADMKLAANTPVDAILFNIDAKSDSNSKQDKDAIVNVFLRVFNEMQGFCGSQPALADLERKLSDAGRFDEFKRTFDEAYGGAWEDSRQDFDFIQDSVVEVLSGMGFMSESAARNWCEKAVESYQISIEDFAKRVKTYIDRKGGNHHVVFLVDEIGQYIGEDSKLMLNLQTVTEELGKECMGKAWVIVTSQQDIDSITNVKGNDFSKIQGRFDTRLSLSSANVDEVIKRRILEKNDTAAQSLRLLYEQKETDIRNKVLFTSNAEKKLYVDGNDFAAIYPFVGYQFNLLASVLTAVRTHSSSGKHLSEGERSMLAMFKESAEQLKEQEVGALVPFHMFYDAMENFLDHSHKGVIIRAYDNSHINPDKLESGVFAINVLKDLFLIKYVLEIEANVDNITSLMIGHMETNRLTLKGQVEDALKVLMREMLVQKNGSVYVFLTDEEQEINREIERQEIEPNAVPKKVAELVFDDIFQDKKYRCPAFGGRYAFAYRQAVDDLPYKMTLNYDIGLRILTSRYDGGLDDSTLRIRSGQEKEVLVVLPDDMAFWNELQTYLKIEKFLQGPAASQYSKYEDIKGAKRKEMRKRSEDAKLYLTEALKEASIYVNGDLARISSKDISARFNEALGRLVQTVYHKLSYIDTPMDEANIRQLMRRAGSQLSIGSDGATANQHALEDMLSYIAGNSRIHTKTSMKTVKDRFMKAPYGFVEDDIHWLIACLFQRGDLDFTVNGTAVTRTNTSDEEIINFITKKAFAEKLLMEEHTRVPEKEKKAVREVMKELFHVSSVTEDEDSQMQDFQRYSRNLLRDFEELERNYHDCPSYPGKKVVELGKQLLRTVEPLQRPLEFFQTVSRRRDDFLDLAEDYEPVRAFFHGEQREIFRRAVELLAIYDDSKTYIVDAALENTVAQMRSILRKEYPYGDIPRLPELRQKYTAAYMKVLKAESAPVLDSIGQAKNRVFEVLNTKEYAEEKKERYLSQFAELRDGAEHCNNVSTLRSYKDKAEALKIRLLNEMDALDAQLALKKAEEEAKRQEKAAQALGIPAPEEQKPAAYKPRKTRNVTIKSMARTSSWRLEKPEDIDKVLSELRKALTAELSENDIVNVEF